MGIRKRTVVIVCASLLVAIMSLIVVPCIVLIREQHATVKSIEKCRAKVSSYWLPADSAKQKSDWYLSPEWCANKLSAQPRDVIIYGDTSLRAIDLLKEIPTVERVVFIYENFSSPRGKDIIGRLNTAKQIKNLTLVTCNGMLDANEEFATLKQIELLAIMRPKDGRCASLSFVEQWPQLNTLLIIDASICDNNLIHPVDSLTDLCFAMCQFEPGEFSNLSRFSNLLRLSLYETEIPDFNIDVLKPLQKIRELELSTASISQEEVTQLLKDHPLLRELVLPFSWDDEQISAISTTFPEVSISRYEEQIPKSFWDRMPIKNESGGQEDVNKED